MTRQTINLLGGVVVAAILLAGVLLGVLPRLDAAGQSHDQRDTVASQNESQQMLVSVYAGKRAALPQVEQQVARLKQQIATGPHLEQLIDVASGLPAGAVLRSITPSEPTDGAAAPAAATGDFAELSVVMVISLPKASGASQVLDKLRSGPRLFLIDRATVTPAGGSDTAEGGTTLTVTGRVFMKEETS